MATDKPSATAKPRKPSAKRPRSDRSSVVEVIDRPLGFYVLALFIVESFLAVVLVGSNLGEDHRFYGMLLGTSQFVLVVLLVFVLTYWRPQNLTYDKEAHFRERNPLKFGTELRALSDVDTLTPTPPPTITTTQSSLTPTPTPPQWTDR